MSPIINWMGGWPKDGVISAVDWEERLATAAGDRERGTRRPAFETFAAESNERVRRQLADDLLRAGPAGGSGIPLTLAAGADGALARIVDTQLMPGDTVLTEKLTSRSALQTFRKAGLTVKAVDTDASGPDPSALTTALYRYRPKLVYVAPQCSDPEGKRWGAGRLCIVEERCLEAGVTLVTDDRQGLLLFDPEETALPRRAEAGLLSIGQLPPGLIAGLKLGWIAGAGKKPLQEPETAFQRKDSGIALEQAALADLMEEQPLGPLIELLTAQYRERMRRMAEQLQALGVPGLSWSPPVGGLHLWVRLPEGLDGEALLRDAWLKGLLFQPGGPFYAKEPQTNTVRLTYAFADERQLKLGMSRLKTSIGEFMGRSV